MPDALEVVYRKGVLRSLADYVISQLPEADAPWTFVIKSDQSNTFLRSQFALGDNKMS